MYYRLQSNMGILGMSGEREKDFTLHPRDPYCVTCGSGRILKIKDMTEVDGLTLEANQSVLVFPQTSPKPKRGFIQVSINPEILKHGVLASPSAVTHYWDAVDAKDERFFAVVLRSTKKIELSSFNHVFEFRYIAQ